MTTNQRPTGDPRQLPSRRARRAAARADAGQRDPRLATARTATRKPWWQDPMIWLTVGAVAVGVVIILLASGILGGNSKLTGRIVAPLTTKPADLVDPANPRALGDPAAPITFDVWADFQCSACELYSTQIEPTIIDEYVKTGKVHLVFHDYAFIDAKSSTKESQDAAAAARCATAQGDFWQYHDWLYANWKGENVGGFSRDRLRLIAEKVGLDLTAYDACLADGAAHAAVKAETQQGIDLTINSTPTLVINGELVRGALPLDTLRAKFDAILSGASPSPSAPGSPSPSGSPGASASPAASGSPVATGSPSASASPTASPTPTP